MDKDLNKWENIDIKMKEDSNKISLKTFDMNEHMRKLEETMDKLISITGSRQQRRQENIMKNWITFTTVVGNIYISIKMAKTILQVLNKLF